MRIDDENKVVWCSGELLDWYNSFNGSSVRKDMMVYYISRIGWGYVLTDNDNKKIDAEFYINIDKLLLIKAIIDDYEFKLEQPQKYYWRKKKEYSAWFEVAQDTYLAQDEDDGELTLGWLEGAGWKCKFTEQEARNILKNDFDMFERVEV